MTRYIGSLGGTILILLLWEASIRVFDVPVWLLPAPTTIAVTGWEWRAELGAHTIVTLSETLKGFGLALLVGVPLAALLVSSPLLWQAIYPPLAGLQAVPKNAIAPILIVWFGAGEVSKIAITFLISFFPILVNTATGMSLVESEMLHLARSIRASRLQTFLHIRLPNSLPYLFAACKISITLAVVGAVIGEFVGSDAGLGYLILVASSQLKTDLAFVAITILSAGGMALFWIVGLVERYAVPWQTPQSEGPTL